MSASFNFHLSIYWGPKMDFVACNGPFRRWNITLQKGLKWELRFFDRKTGYIWSTDKPYEKQVREHYGV